ncbi:MAG TPA: DUF4365 domain-containing protein [Bacteroidetes bacterium]|nr:DUF4365 domain-containing protein [Bacteroidota bacterium]
MRKLRTRQHVIEDLSYNYVEKQVLLANGIFERYNFRQYSYDGHIFTFNPKGEMEGGFMFVQLKATDKLKFSTKNNGYILQLDKRDLDLWIAEKLPVIVVLYDAENDLALYIELETYFKENRILLKEINKFMRVFIPKENVFTFGIVDKIRTIKNKTYADNKRF